MKRRVINYTVLILIAIAIIGTIVYVNFDKKDSRDEEEKYESVEANTKDYTSLTIFEAFYGSLSSSTEIEGRVTTDEEEFVDIYTISGKLAEDIELGTTVEKGTMLISGSTELSAKNSGKVVKIEEENNITNVYVLDYNRLYINIYIDKDIFNMIDYNSDVKLLYNDKYIEASVEYIDYKLVDEMVNVKIKPYNVIDFLPGESVKVYITMCPTAEKTYLPKDAIIFIGDIAYCDVMHEDESIVRNRLELGELVNTFENGTLLQYYEVISGVNCSDKIIIER